MPLDLTAAIVVYCTTFVAACLVLSIWRRSHVAELAAAIAIVPAILAYAIM